jgi:hypothetical protein
MSATHAKKRFQAWNEETNKTATLEHVLFIENRLHGLDQKPLLFRIEQ